jgi:proteasome lid subunit RPN8/RPN11
MAKVVLSAQARQSIRTDMLRRPRIEACGLLIGEMTEAGDWIIDQAIPLRNRDNSAVSFKFDPEEMYAYDEAYGERVIAVYHSHPGGAPYPSSKDKKNMEESQESYWAWLIASFHGRAQRGDGADDNLQIAAYRHDPRSGLQTIPVLIAAASE